MFTILHENTLTSFKILLNKQKYDSNKQLIEFLIKCLSFGFTGFNIYNLFLAKN
jgi:hypothetical protein